MQEAMYARGSSSHSIGMFAGDTVQPSPVSLSDLADEIFERVAAVITWGRTDLSELNDYKESIAVKNASGVVVYCNDAHRRVFSPSVSPIGRTSHAYLDPVAAGRAEAMAGLVMGGCPYIEAEYSGPGPDGSIYRMAAHKRSLKEMGSPGIALLTVVRVVERKASSEHVGQTDLASNCTRFCELAERDQEICRLTALGVTSRELGERFDMSTRGIELRKKKAFAVLGVVKAVDLARLLVRLQERGFIDLGL